MDSCITVLIADDNAEFGNALRDYLDNGGDMTVSGVAADGLETIRMMGEQEPDVVILDLIMPNLDGIGVLERYESLGLKRRPIFIVLSAIGHDSIIRKAIQLGADYYMIKPFDIALLEKRIRQLYSERYAENDGENAGPGKEKISGKENIFTAEMGENRLEIIVTELIRDMGILPNIAGFHYLREAVVLSVKDPDLLASAARKLYPLIAQKHNTSANKVGRAIRSAIENSVSTNFSDEGANTNIKVIANLAGKAKIMLE